jgi:hypothetical protein
LLNITSTGGTVDRATVMWSANPTVQCANAFKVVFLSGGPSSFSVDAVRGPFTVAAGRNTVTLSPPVTLSASTTEMLGIVQLQPSATCGNLNFANVPNSMGYSLITAGDISTNGKPGTPAIYATGNVMAAVAYNSADEPLLVRVLPAAGAVQGSGAFFRTSVQLLNDGATPITGKLVFHPQGQSASPGDPSLAYTLPKFGTLSFPDVVTNMGASGLGSLDVRADGGMTPIVTARVYSDGGSAGTSGFTEDALDPGNALTYLSHSVLFIPADTTNFRMNVGVRTLGSGLQGLEIDTYSAAGNLVAQRLNVSFPPNFFQQFTAQQFTGAATLPAGGYISLTVQQPSSNVFIYGTVTDNRTQDSSMKVAGVY